MDDWTVEPLSPAHERDKFACGELSLDHFLRSLAGQYARKRIGRTFVALRGGSSQVVGYYTLASGAIPVETLPPRAARKLPRHPVPVVLLARLAVDASERGRGLGRHLLGDALRRCLQLADRLGVNAVEVGRCPERRSQDVLREARLRRPRRRPAPPLPPDRHHRTGARIVRAGLVDQSTHAKTPFTHESMLGNVRLNREIMAAWEGEFGRP